MKIIDIQTGDGLTSPFSLGELGQGRLLKEITAALRNQPADWSDVGFVSDGTDCWITAPQKRRQKGVIIRINTSGTKPQGNNGSIVLRGGKAQKLASGKFAYGTQGQHGFAPDELWHVEGTALFAINICGGSSENRHYLAVMGERTLFVPTAKFCTIIAEDAAVAQIVLPHAEKLGNPVRKALGLAPRKR